MIQDEGHHAVIEVDGGIDVDTIAEVVPAGAEILVAGSAIFRSPEPARAVKEMLAKASALGYHSKYA